MQVRISIITMYMEPLRIKMARMEADRMFLAKGMSCKAEI
jgi:hypothetical protein